MIKIIKKFQLAIAAILSAVLFWPNLSLAGDLSGFLNTAASIGGYETNNVNELSFFVAIGLIAQVLLTILGVVFVSLMIYGGYIWMIARGNEDEVDKGKSIIIDATIGLVLVLSAAVISNFVLSSLL